MITRYTKNVATTMQRIWYYGGSVPYILDSSFRIGAVHLFICLYVCLSRPPTKNTIFSKSKQLRAVVSIDDL